MPLTLLDPRHALIRPFLMATRTEFGLQPKKRVTTYGKGSRRNTQSSGFEAFRNDKSSSSANNLQNPSAQSSTAAVPAHPKPTKKSEHLDHVYGFKVHPEPGRECRNIPAASSWDVPQKDEDTTRAKKRKLGGTSSSTTRKLDSSAYSPPSSPPSSPSLVQPQEKDTGLGASRHLGRLKAGSRAAQGNNTLPKDAAQAPSSQSPETLLDRNVVGSDYTQHAQQPIPFRLTKDGQAQPARPAKMGLAKTGLAETGPTSKAGTSKQAEPAVSTRRKKRLIDALVAQVEENSEEEPSSQDVEMTLVSSPPAPVLPSSPGPSLPDQPKPRTLTRQLAMPKKPGPKFTYSQQRTMLAEEPLFDPASLSSIEDQPEKAPFPGLGAMIKTSTLSSLSFIDEEDDTANSGAVRSLHELRQAGANSRFSDEMDDILDRIGSPTPKPSSLRRGALLELAEKMKDKSFRRQFRNHSRDGALFTKLGQETDIIAGFAILSIVTTLLSTSTSPHVIQKLQTQGIAQLLSLFLALTSDISAIGKERKRNVSKNGQSTLSAIKATILQLPIWEPMSPTILSPRTLALKAMDLILRQSTDLESEAAVFSPDVTDCLFSILSDFANPACWELPSRPESVDFYLALYLLETHSVSAMQSQLWSRWTSRYLPIVGDVLETALRRPADKMDDLESLALRLTLNTTNNNTEAPGMFVKRGILRDLAEAACKTFEVVLKSITDDSFMSKVLESLIFMLGVKINFCEHYTPAAQSLYEMEDDTSSPLNRLIRVFLDYHSTTSDVSHLW